MRYFCGKCSAESEAQLPYCVACGMMSLYVPMVYLHNRQSVRLRYRTARQLAYGKTKMISLPSLWDVPATDPFQMAVFGPPGGGKSSLMLKMARALADHAIPSVYVSAEEGFGPTVGEKLRLMELCTDDVYFVEGCNVESAVQFAESKGARWIFADSYSVLRWNVPDLLKVRSQKMSLVFALHITKDGEAAGEMAVCHEADTVVRVTEGKWEHTKNRFGTLQNGEVFIVQPAA